jgi:hypothetical protein
MFEPLDWSSTTATVKSLQRVAARLGVALGRSIGLLPETVARDLMSLLTTENLWALALVFACWLLASVVGGPVGVAVNAILVAWALWEVPKVVEELAGTLKEGLVTAYRAQSDADLDHAAAEFAAVLSAVGVGTLQVVVTHKLFVMGKAKLLSRFPAPKVLEVELKRSRERIDRDKSAKKKKDAETKKAEGTKKVDKKRLNSIEPETDSKPNKRIPDSEPKPSRLVQAAELGAAAGVKPAADGLSSQTALVVGSAIAGVALIGAGLAVAASGKRRRSKNGQ